MTKGRNTEVEVSESKYRKGRRYENGRSTEKVQLMRTQKIGQLFMAKFKKIAKRGKIREIVKMRNSQNWGKLRKNYSKNYLKIRLIGEFVCKRCEFPQKCLKFGGFFYIGNLKIY